MRMRERRATPRELLELAVAELGAAPDDPTVARARALLATPTSSAPPQLWDALVASLEWALALDEQARAAG